MNINFNRDVKATGTYSIVSCSTRDHSPRDLCIMTFVRKSLRTMIEKSSFLTIVLRLVYLVIFFHVIIRVAVWTVWHIIGVFVKFLSPSVTGSSLNFLRSSAHYFVEKI